MGVGCPAPHATYPEARTGRPQTLPYLVLLQVGFTELPRSPGELVRSYRTFSPLPGEIGAGPYHRAVSFLWHFPSRHRDSALRSTLPCGARTFLPPLDGLKDTSDRLAYSDTTNGNPEITRHVNGRKYSTLIAPQAQYFSSAFRSWKV